MNTEKRYISKNDFHERKDFIKIDKHIDTCLILIERLIDYNTECRNEVSKILKIENYVIDYRTEQFGYIETILRNIYFSCYSLKNIFDASTFMNSRKLENTIGFTLSTQSTYVSFTGIVMLSSIFEYTRNEFEMNIKGAPYFDKLRAKYLDKVNSLKLLNDFRNTIHSNTKWNPRNKTDNLIYNLREGKKIIEPGQPFDCDNWKIYRIIKDCLELNMLMALNNKAKQIRETRQKINGVTLAVAETGLSKEDLSQLFNVNKY